MGATRCTPAAYYQDAAHDNGDDKQHQPEQDAANRYAEDRL
jgi:hypothetical protein